MAIPVTGIGSGATASAIGSRPAAAAHAGEGFGDTLGAPLSSVESRAGDANTAVAGMIDGSGDVHTAMLALQRAEVSMQLTVQVRNKLVQAYQDLMRMPI